VRLWVEGCASGLATCPLAHMLYFGNRLVLSEPKRGWRACASTVDCSVTPICGGHDARFRRKAPEKPRPSPSSIRGGGPAAIGHGGSPRAHQRAPPRPRRSSRLTASSARNDGSA
jgi:hypothetical protein